MAQEQKKVIERLRELIARLNGGGDRDELWDEYDEATELLNEAGHEEDSSFEEGSRWSNHRVTVYSVGGGDAKTYFRLTDEIPASEMQEGMPLSFWLEEVEPVEVTTIEWREKRKLRRWTA